MDVHALTVKAVRDGPVCTVILRGDLDLAETDGFLELAEETTEIAPGAMAGFLSYQSLIN